MVSDSEPRYRLVDSQGNTVGTLYAKSGGTLALQEGSSGSDNEIELQTDGTLQTDSLNTDQLQSNRIENPNDSDNIVITQSETLSAGSKAALLPSIAKSEKAGFLTVRFGNGSGLFLVEGNDGDVSAVADPRNSFSTSEGTSTSVNVYWDSSNTRYEVENGFSFSNTIQIVFLS